MADDRALEDPATAIGRIDGALADLQSTVLARLSRRPTGDIEPCIRATPKDGTLFMQGQTLNRADYPALWAWAQANGAVVAGGFGIGNGTTTFTLPDLRGRVLVGAGTLGADTYALGATGGASTKAIATANLPAHDHNVTLSQHEGHSHAVFGDGGHGGHFPGSQFVAAAGADYGLAAWNSGGSGVGDHSHGMSIEGGGKPHTVTESTIGSGTAFDVRQPYLAVQWLIWT